MPDPEQLNIDGPQTLVLDATHVRLIVAVLRKQPYEMVANVLDDVKAQLIKNGAKLSTVVAPRTRTAPGPPAHRILKECLEADKARTAAKNGASVEKT